MSVGVTAMKTATVLEVAAVVERHVIASPKLILVHNLVHELLPTDAGRAQFGVPAACRDQVFRVSPGQR